MTVPEAAKECLALATDEQLALGLEETERQIALLRDFAHQIRNAQHRRLLEALERGKP